MTASHSPASARMKEPQSAPANSPQPLREPRKHRWADKVVISPHLSRRGCVNGCGIYKLSRHEFEGGRDVYWTEFWRGLERIEGGGTPTCTGAPKALAYDARNYPL